MKRLLIIGGSDAGISAALRACEVDPSTQVSVLVADRFPNFSICGLPFFLSHEITDWRALAHRTEEELLKANIRLHLEQTALSIDPVARLVIGVDVAGSMQHLPYDRLIIATGAMPAHPSFPGLDLSGVYFLHTMHDTFALEQYLSASQPRRAVILGGGYIGVEMADALTKRGMHVTIMDHHPTLLKTVDPSLGNMIHQEMQRHGVVVVTGVTAQQIAQEKGHLLVHGSSDITLPADLVLVVAGVRPVSSLAKTAGIATGKHGAIQVTQTMETNVPDIFAAGDCVETWHHLLGAPTYLPLGTTAHKQGRIAGENAVGGHRHFAGTLGTQVVKVFDLAIARTGLRDGEAKEAGFDPLTVETTVFDHNVYYPGAQKLCLRITGDRKSGRLLGAQLAGHWRAEVAKRLDIFATALFHNMPVEAFNDLDLSYTPPVSSPWDPVQKASQHWVDQWLREQTPLRNV